METLNLESFKAKVFNFESSKEWAFKGARPAILDFYADWCGPCHMLAPIFEKVSEDYQGAVDFYKINTEESPELSALFEVRGIPSLLFIPMNGEPAMSSGVMSEEGFEAAISDLFQISKPKK
ncbi:thioredoxin fold domain-containing protein [bacterium]|nr:thioredoxin fold domain-containing protein [bacterium]